MAKRRVLLDFGFDPAESAYHFVLLSAVDGSRLEERFHWGEQASGPEPRPKAMLDGYRWQRIAGPAADDFNARLTKGRGKPADWKAGETLLAPHLGKELALLFWTVEEADPSLLPNMLANWKGLAPEERWWLYTTVNATSGHPEHGRDRGWRKAIKIAFAENPVGEVSPSALLDGARRERRLLPLPARPRRKPQPAPEQQSLGLD